MIHIFARIVQPYYIVYLHSLIAIRKCLQFFFFLSNFPLKLLLLSIIIIIYLVLFKYNNSSYYYYIRYWGQFQCYFSISKILLNKIIVYISFYFIFMNEV